jgi:hypothetical protein
MKSLPTWYATPEAELGPELTELLLRPYRRG